MIFANSIKVAERFILLLICATQPVNATDLTGTYYTVSPVESSALNTAASTAAVLTIEQTGSLLNGTLQASAWSIEFSGASDGSNMANVGATLNQGDQVSDGFMILRWHRNGLQASLVIKGNRKISGQYHFATTQP